MKKTFSSKGFTLIELLVVVAIIGILATVVLASLGSARDSAKDAKIKATLSAMRSQAELQYDGDYDSVCNPSTVDGTESGRMFASAFDNISGTFTGSVLCADTRRYYYGTSPSGFPSADPWAPVEYDTNGSGWSADIRLNSGKFFCVDSIGGSGEYDTLTTGGNDKTCG